MTGSNSDLPKISPLALAGHPNKDQRLQAAKDLNDQKEPALPVLVLLQSDVDPQVRQAATPWPTFEPEREIELAFISDDTDPTVREFLARYARDQYTLSKLARDADAKVRASVALNCHAPELLTSFARDESEDVRYALADNSDCPTGLLSELRQDRSERVSDKAKDELKRRKRSIHDHLDDQDQYSEWAKWSSAAQDLLQFDAGDHVQLLRSLARESAKLGLGRVLRQSWIPEDVLRELAGASKQYYVVLHAIAANPAAPPDVLSELSYTGVYSSFHSNDACDTACAALRNPRTPPETLKAFATGNGYFGGQVCTQEREAAWSNPSIPESLILSKPADRAAKEGIASNPSAPGFVLAKLAQDDDVHVRYEVAGNASTPPEVLLSLSQSSLKDLSYGHAKPLAENPSAAREVFVALLQYPELRSWLAHSRRTPPDILVRLTTDEDPRTRLTAALNPATPESAVEHLRDDPAVNELAYLDNVGWARDRALRETDEREIEARPLYCPRTPTEAAATLIGSLSVSDRSTLATYAGPFFTVEGEFLLTTLAEDPQPSVRRNVASNRHCTEAIRRRLAQDPDDEVRSTVAYHTANPEIAASLVDDEAASRNVLSNLATPARALTRLLEKSPDLASQVAAHPNATSDLLRKIASSPTPGSQKSVARHPKSDANALAMIASEADALVRQLVAAHRNASADVLTQLGGDDDELVRTIVAMHSRTPVSALTALAKDDNATVRQAVALQPSLPLDEWAGLVGDSDPRVRAAARENLPSSIEERRRIAADPGTHAELLELLGSANDASVRHSVASNPSCPPSVLISLSSDTDELIRTTVSKRPDAPSEALEQLARDQKWAIRRSAKSALRRRR